MDFLIVISFLIILIGMGIFLAKYARVLREAVDYSNEKDIEIFGARYKNVYHLMSDMSFMNALWEKNCYMNITDNTLSQLIKKAHGMFRAQMYFGLLIFFVPMIIAFINAGN